MKASTAIAAAILLSACAQPARPSTTYEVWNYSVSIPDDLGAEPEFSDPAVIWRSGVIFLGSGEGSASLMIQMRGKVEAVGTDGETAKALLERNTPAIGTVGPITTREFPGGWGAQFRWVTGQGSRQRSLDAAYLYHDGQAVSFLADGMTPDDLALIMQSFRFRDPPGDFDTPPSPS